MRNLRKNGKPPGNGNNNYAARSRYPEKYPEKLGAAWNWWSENVVTKRWSENINGWVGRKVGRSVGRNQEKIYFEGRVPTKAPARRVLWRGHWVVGKK